MGPGIELGDQRCSGNLGGELACVSCCDDGDPLVITILVHHDASSADVPDRSFVLHASFGCPLSIPDVDDVSEEFWQRIERDGADPFEQIVGAEHLIGDDDATKAEWIVEVAVFGVGWSAVGDFYRSWELDHSPSLPPVEHMRSGVAWGKVAVVQLAG